MDIDKIVLDDVYGIWYIPFYKTTAGVFLIALGIFSVILLCVVVTKFLLKPKKVSYLEKILKDLELLKSESNSKKSVSLGYLQLTSIFKNYCSTRFKLNSGLTDFELLEALEKRKLCQNFVFDLSAILSRGQKVKFAKKDIAKNNLSKDLDYISDFIKFTKISKNTSMNA